MLISNSSKFIFFHIPKCGGTSVVKLLEKYAKWNDIVVGGTEVGEVFQRLWSPRFHIYKHSFPEEIKSVIGDLLYYEYKKFVICRNPLSRFHSAYNFMISLRESKAEWFVNSGDFKEIEKSLDSIDLFISSDYFLNIFKKRKVSLTDIERLFVPQSEYFDQNASNFSFIKLESISEDIAPILEVAGIADNNKLIFPKTNVTKLIEGNKISLDSSIIKKLYESDYKLFDY